MIRCEGCGRRVVTRSNGRRAYVHHHAIKQHTLCKGCWERLLDKTRQVPEKEREKQ